MTFDEYAKNWDTDYRIQRGKLISEEIEKSLEGATVSNAMEFGCGTGLVGFNLLYRFDTMSLVDTSKGMLDVVRAKIDQYKVNNVVGIECDLSNNGVIDDTFDVIFSSMVLHHIHDTTHLLNTFKKMTNPDGYLIIVDLNEEDGKFHKEFHGFDGHNGFKQEELKAMLSDAGYSDIEFHTFYKDFRHFKDEDVPYSLFIMKARLR